MKIGTLKLVHYVSPYFEPIIARLISRRGADDSFEVRMCRNRRLSHNA